MFPVSQASAVTGAARRDAQPRVNSLPCDNAFSSSSVSCFVASAAALRKNKSLKSVGTNVDFTAFSTVVLLAELEHVTGHRTALLINRLSSLNLTATERYLIGIFMSRFSNI